MYEIGWYKWQIRIGWFNGATIDFYAQFSCLPWHDELSLSLLNKVVRSNWNKKHIDIEAGSMASAASETNRQYFDIFSDLSFSQNDQKSQLVVMLIYLFVGCLVLTHSHIILRSILHQS